MRATGRTAFENLILSLSKDKVFAAHDYFNTRKKRLGRALVNQVHGLNR
jgi:hypothetical protein